MFCCLRKKIIYFRAGNSSKRRPNVFMVQNAPLPARNENTVAHKCKVFKSTGERGGALTHMARATINHKSGATPLWGMFWGANK
jgi:hypothetical protein